MTRTRSAVWVLLLMATAACTSSQDTASPNPESSAPATSTPVQTSEARPKKPKPVTPPPLDEGLGEVRAGQQPATRGNAVFAYTGGERGKALILAASCKGGGKITVEVPAIQVSFPLECPADEPFVTYNQFALKTAHKAGTVAVKAPPTVTWSVTVGRGKPVSEDMAG